MVISMKESENNNIKQAVVKDMSDDLTTLNHIFSLPDLNYFDIALQEQLEKISTRWSLIKELSSIKLK